MKRKLKNAVNEKDVENIYRAMLLKYADGEITSPHGVDGLLVADDIRTLLEFKYNDNLKDKLCQSGILIQCLYYLKKFEAKGEILPSTIFVGDLDECFALSTNSIAKYLLSSINWKLAPSTASKRNPELLQAMVNDQNILPFVFNIDKKFRITSAIAKIKALSSNVIVKVKITSQNIMAIFDYFDVNVLSKNVKLTTNEKANLFMQIIINSTENYLHPRRKNALITRSFGDLRVNQNLFNSFFSHFEGEAYSPSEKEQLTGLVDRLITDKVRRSKGEFFTPTAFVDKAHDYLDKAFGSDWRSKYVVWDCCCAVGNLTRDYRFRELYCSTLEQSDLDTAEQSGYNPEATKFQFDFLNGNDSELPSELQLALRSGKKLLFLINPPYATAGNFKTDGTHKAGVAKTCINLEMKSEDWGACSQSLYAQFLYRIFKYQEINKNIRVGLFSPPLYMSGSSYKKFRAKFFDKFAYKSGMLFQASHFADVSGDWGITFSVLDNKPNENKFMFDLVDTENFELNTVGKKEIYNTDNYKSCNEWVKSSRKAKHKTFCMKSALKLGVKEKLVIDKSIAELIIHNNNCKSNGTQVYLLCKPAMNDNSQSVSTDNFFKCCALFTARKAIQSDWITQKDEYLAPNEEHPDYKQFVIDSVVYSLFNNSSQQSALRQVEYKGKLWDIKNEFFWLSPKQMKQLAEKHNYDELYKDARTSEDRHVYKLLNGGLHSRLSTDATQVLDTAVDLLELSIRERKLLSQQHPEYHLDSWDAGYAQLKLVWKEFYPEKFKAFREQYKKFEGRLIPLVYELGFLRK